MDFYDLHVEIEDLKEIDEVIEISKKLGYSGIGITLKYANLNDLKELKKIKSEIDLVSCVEISAQGVKELKRKISKARKIVDIVIVSGGDYKINRAAAEDSRVDILSHPEYKRMDSGVDHIIARAAGENNVAIEINFHEILETFRKIRAHVLGHMRNNIHLALEYNVPIVITSSALNKWELRGPRELAAIGQAIGMSLEDSMKSVSDIPKGIVDENRRKLRVVSHG